MLILTCSPVTGVASEAPIAWGLKKAFDELPDGQELSVTVVAALEQAQVQAYKTVACGK